MTYIYIHNYRKPVKGKIRLIKLDKCKPGKKLAYAIFALYLLNKITQKYELLMDHLSTDKDGELVIHNLAIGKYYLIETDSPPGYLQNKKQFFVEIGVDKTGTVIEPERIVAYNEEIPHCCHKRCCCKQCRPSRCCCCYCCYCRCYHFYRY